jgi:ribosomal protein L7/L12
VSDHRIEMRVAQLEQKVSELYRRIGESEPGFEEGAAAAGQNPELIEALRDNNEIKAIKIYRGMTGAGLAEAKKAVDEIARLHKPIG